MRSALYLTFNGWILRYDFANIQVACESGRVPQRGQPAPGGLFSSALGAIGFRKVIHKHMVRLRNPSEPTQPLQRPIEAQSGRSRRRLRLSALSALVD